MRCLIRNITRKRSGITHEDKPFTGDTITIGRAAAHQIFLSDIRVALTHARISQTPDGKFQVQAQALSGVRVNGESTGMSNIVPGDVLMIGSCRIEVAAAPEGYDLCLEVEQPKAGAEDTATLAYTRYVLERGLSGDLLDLQIALAPCVLGYAEIGTALAGQAGANNPYSAWIEMYAGEEYQEVARDAAAHIEKLAAERGAAQRIDSLKRTFSEATRLEIAFWEQALTVEKNGSAGNPAYSPPHEFARDR